MTASVSVCIRMRSPPRTFHSLALHIISQGSKKVPTVSKLENECYRAQQTLYNNLASAVQ